MELQARELRVGNYYDNNGETKQVTPSTIEELWRSERTWIKPIPLTEEWLLKFGFKNASEGFLSVKTKRRGIGLEINIKAKRAILFNNLNKSYIDFIIPKNVNQLQNLYFALCGEELTLKNKL